LRMRTFWSKPSVRAFTVHPLFFPPFFFGGSRGSYTCWFFLMVGLWLLLFKAACQIKRALAFPPFPPPLKEVPALLSLRQHIFLIFCFLPSPPRGPFFLFFPHFLLLNGLHETSLFPRFFRSISCILLSTTSIDVPPPPDFLLFPPLPVHWTPPTFARAFERGPPPHPTHFFPMIFCLAFFFPFLRCWSLPQYLRPCFRYPLHIWSALAFPLYLCSSLPHGPLTVAYLPNMVCTFFVLSSSFPPTPILV